MNLELAEGLEEEADAGDTYAPARKAYATPEERLRNMIRAIVGDVNSALRFGSDTPSGPFNTQLTGLNGFREIEAWGAAGVELREIFRAITIDNAELLGLGKEIGQVAVGMRADLLLLDANPLESINAYDSISTVILRGKPIDRNSLSAQ
jgi:imidazolonepropionase-like amidohydrolase